MQRRALTILIDTVAASVNWWLHKQPRLQFSYFNSDATLSGPNVASGEGLVNGLGLQDVYAAATTNDLLNEDTVDGFVARLQFDF